jgi:hypothetical protein
MIPSFSDITDIPVRSVSAAHARHGFDPSSLCTEFPWRGFRHEITRPAMHGRGRRISWRNKMCSASKEMKECIMSAEKMTTPLAKAAIGYRHAEQAIVGTAILTMTTVMRRSLLTPASSYRQWQPAFEACGARQRGLRRSRELERFVRHSPSPEARTP